MLMEMLREPSSSQNHQEFNSDPGFLSTGGSLENSPKGDTLNTGHTHILRMDLLQPQHLVGFFSFFQLLSGGRPFKFTDRKEGKLPWTPNDG